MDEAIPLKNVVGKAAAPRKKNGDAAARERENRRVGGNPHRRSYATAIPPAYIGFPQFYCISRPPPTLPGTLPAAVPDERNQSVAASCAESAWLMR